MNCFCYRVMAAVDRGQTDRRHCKALEARRGHEMLVAGAASVLGIRFVAGQERAAKLWKAGNKVISINEVYIWPQSFKVLVYLSHLYQYDNKATVTKRCQMKKVSTAPTWSFNPPVVVRIDAHILLFQVKSIVATI